MDIDMSALRGLVREKEISFDLLVEAIESALLIAYHRTEGSRRRARVELDRNTGHVTVWAKEDPADLEEGAGAQASSTTPRPASAGSPRPPPSRSSCSGCATPRTTSPSASTPAARATSSPASSSRARTPRTCWSTSASWRPSCRCRSRCPARSTRTALRLRTYVVRVAKGVRGPSVTLSRTHPNLVKKLFALEVPEIADGSVEIAAIAREAGHRTKIAVRSTRSGLNAKGACIGPMGGRVRNVMAELHGEKIDIVDWSDDPAELVANALSPARVSKVEVVDLGGALRPGDRARLPAVAGHRQGGPERPPRRPAHRLAHRHPARTRRTQRTRPQDVGQDRSGMPRRPRPSRLEGRARPRADGTRRAAVRSYPEGVRSVRGGRLKRVWPDACPRMP